MTTMIIELYKALTEAGVKPETAEHAATAVAHAAEVATKHDLEVVETRIKAHLDREIAEAKADIVKWLAGLMIAQAAVISAMVKLL